MPPSLPEAAAAPSSKTFGEGTTFALLVASMPAILVLDSLVTSDLSVHLLYAFPVAFAGRNLGVRTGFVMAAVAALATIVVALATRASGQSVAIVAAEGVLALALFGLLATLASRLRGLELAVLANSRVDEQTGALSRREFERLFDEETRRARRYRRPLVVMLVEIPESPREPAGLLAAAVRAVAGMVREGDSVSRLAARRFAVLLVECSAPEAAQIASRLGGTLAANLRLPKPGAAFGVVSYGGSLPASAADLMALATSHVELARNGTGFAETRVD